jgi:CBS domain-containing protein
VRLDRIARPDPPAVGRRTSLADAVRLMRTRRLAALPVIQGDRLVGLLTDDDLLELLAALLDGEPPPSRPRAV